MKKITLIISLFLLSVVFANEAYTLQKTIDYALENSPRYEIIKRDKTITRAQAYQGYAAVLPHLSYSYADTQRKPMFPGSDETNVITKEFSANQLLFSFSGIAALKASGASLKYADYMYEDARATFILDIKKAFYNLYAAQEIMQVNQKVYEQATQHARNAELRYQGGLITKKDYLDAKIKALESKQSRDRANNHYTLALNSFNNLIGRNINDSLQLELPEISVVADIADQQFDVDDLLAKATVIRPGFLAFKELLRLAEADDVNAIGESLPALYFNYSNSDSDYKDETMMAQSGNTETKTIYASWNFYSGGANFHKINEKRNYKVKMKQTEKNMRDALAIEINSSVQSLKLAVLNYLAAADALEMAQESLKLAELSFKNGAATNTQYQDSLAQYAAAEVAKIRSTFDYAYAKDKLNYAVGEEVNYEK